MKIAQVFVQNLRSVINFPERCANSIFGGWNSPKIFFYHRTLFCALSVKTLNYPPPPFFILLDYIYLLYLYTSDENVTPFLLSFLSDLNYLFNCDVFIDL